MTDSKEWVTIKVPKDVRDDAREDERTYEDIMRAGLEDTPESTEVDLDEIHKKLDQIQGAQAGTVEEALTIAEENDIREIEAELDKLKELVENVPTETSETFAEKYK